MNCLIFSLPLCICLCFFLIDDPFGIFYKDACLAESSEDILNTRRYIKSDKTYTSFIFGNSRTHSFHEADWKTHVGNGCVYHFGSPGESLLNIRKKIELILNHQKINHVLILVDAGILENTDNQHHFYKGPVYDHSPLTSNISYFSFYANYIKYYFENYFFAKHIYYKVTSSYRNEWMKDAFKNPNDTKNEKINSFRYRTLADSLIENNFNQYKKIFEPDYSCFVRNQTFVSPEDSIHLIEIKKMLDSNAINYKFIIPPDFMGKKIAPEIYTTMHRILGNKLYDFTGINKISMDSTLNYENLHFTTKAGAMMLDSIYKN